MRININKLSVDSNEKRINNVRLSVDSGRKLIDIVRKRINNDRLSVDNARKPFNNARKHIDNARKPIDNEQKQFENEQNNMETGLKQPGVLGSIEGSNATALTDAEGNYTLTLNEAGIYALKAGLKGHDDYEDDEIDLPPANLPWLILIWSRRRSFIF